MIPHQLRRRSFLGVVGASAGAALLDACRKEEGSSPGSKSIDWWHIQNTDPMLSVFARLAKDFEAAHPGVKVNVTPLENEAFKAKLTTVAQAGSPPHLFNSWGGGVLRQQVEAGLVKELSGDAAAFLRDVSPTALGIHQIDGKQYGVPYDLGMVGFWYNKELFAKAGVKSTPKT